MLTCDLCLFQFIDLGTGMSMGGDSEVDSDKSMTLTPLTTPSSSSMSLNHTPLSAVSANGTLTLNAANMASMINPVSTTPGSTITMLTSASSAQGPTKTIVVVPVSATPGSGDGMPAAKKIKTL